MHVRVRVRVLYLPLHLDHRTAEALIYCFIGIGNQDSSRYGVVSDVFHFRLKIKTVVISASSVGLLFANSVAEKYSGLT